MIRSIGTFIAYIFGLVFFFFLCGVLNHFLEPYVTATVEIIEKRMDDGMKEFRNKIGGGEQPTNSSPTEFDLIKAYNKDEK